MELSGSALGHFGTAGGNRNPAMPWNIFLHGTLNWWVIRGEGLCTDMFFLDITIVMSGYEWNLSFETRNGFKSHHGLTISPFFFWKFCWVCCGRCKCAMEMPFYGPAWAWVKAMPIPGFSSPFWGMYGTKCWWSSPPQRPQIQHTSRRLEDSEKKQAPPKKPRKT